MAVHSDRPGGVLAGATLRHHALRVLRFGIVSGMGLAIDLSLFLTLIHAKTEAFAANMVSSAAALTFVYCASVRRVFRYDGQFIVPMFAAYVVYHVCGTVIVSLAISGLLHAGVVPALAKIGILPATFTANYLFMSWLTARRERWILRTG